MKNLLPIVVPLEYFKLPPESNVLPGYQAFGIVRLLGNNVASLLVRNDGEILKNVHREDLENAGIHPASAERIALENLSALIVRGEFKAQVTKNTPAGFSYAVWFGGRFTSSCLLWPGLYDWARKQLEADEVIACAPQNQVMCVAARGDAEFRCSIQNYLERIITGMGKQISPEWFELSAQGLAPLPPDRIP